MCRQTMNDGRETIFVDWGVNKHSLRVQLLLVSFRLTGVIYRRFGWLYLVFAPLFVIHKALELALGCELSWKVRCGPRLQLFHLVGLIVNPATMIGSDCVLRHSTTLGGRRGADDAPVIGDRVDVGCHSAVLGSVSIGNDVKIGSGAIVVFDVPSGATVVGGGARVVDR